jgi:hypothetical protein
MVAAAVALAPGVDVAETLAVAPGVGLALVNAFELEVVVVPLVLPGAVVTPRLKLGVTP